MAALIYTLIETDSADDMVRSVNDWISRGWRPHGGVAMARLLSPYTDPVGGSTAYELCSYYAQAMVKDEIDVNDSNQKHD